MNLERYNARTAEVHWQEVWDTQNVFATGNEDPQPGCAEPDSAEPDVRVDMNDVRNFTMGDVVARYRQASGVTVPHPIEWDASHIPPGKAAMAGTVLKSLGLSAGRSRRIAITTPRAVTAAAGTVSPGTNAGIDPADMIDTYGADATRWYVLSDSPPDRDVIWSEAGIVGAWRFVHRLWRIINAATKFSTDAPAVCPAALSRPAVDLRKTAHRALARVSGNIERLRFNVAIACIHAFARALEAAVADRPGPASPDLKFAAREAAEIMVTLFHPMMPHLAEECWNALGNNGLVATRRWPAFEAGLLVDGSVTLPVHVNGRRRADVTVARDARNGDIEVSVLALDVIRRALAGKAPRKVIIVPQRIINVVA